MRELTQQETKLLEATNNVKYDFYLDDLLSGASIEEEAIKLHKEVSELLRKDQFHLRKWRANSNKIFKNLDEMEKSNKLLKLNKES